MKIKNKWLWIFGAVTLLALLNIGVIVTDNLANRDEVHWMYYIINEFTGSWLVLPLLPGLFWLYKKLPITRETFWTRFPMHMFATIVFGTIHTMLMYGVRTPIYEWVGLGSYGDWYGILGYRMVMEYFKQFLVYWIAYVIFMFFEKMRENQQQQLRAAQLEEQLTKSRLQSLQMQLNPHFLFNTLNAISGMMHEDVNAADRMMTTLSEMLRSTFRIKTEEHPLGEEISLLERYIEIMKMRFKDKLEVQMEVDEDARSALVPVFLMQPLLENSIKYGVENRGMVKVNLSVRTNNDKLIMAVQDNGPGIKHATRNGVGLANTLERLEKLFGENHVFQMKNKEGGGLCVTVEIPLHFPKMIAV